MKTVKIVIVAALAIVLNSTVFSQVAEQLTDQSNKTETLKVWGNCNMCKARIEKAASFDGVSKAEWDKDSKLLTVTFNPSKTNIETIAKKIAAVGHDTAKAYAEEKVYDSLPGCCKYERRK